MSRLIWPFLGMLALLIAGMAAYAKPPAGADLNSALSEWYRSLERPDGLSGGCCSASDCRPTAYRTTGDHYEALVDDHWGDQIEPRWIPVPPEKIIKSTVSPTGTAVLCWLPSIGVLCFVLPAMT